MMTATDAANFVRDRLQALGARITQDEMQKLVNELKDVMGRTLYAADVNAVVAAFQELTLPSRVFTFPQARPSAPAMA